MPTLSISISEFFALVIPYLLTFGPLVLQLFALTLIPERRKPAVAQAWLLLIFLTPVVGWIVYLLIGSTKLSRRRRDIQLRANQAILERMQVIQRDPLIAHIHTPKLGPRLAGLVRMSQTLGGMPAFGGNTVEFMPDYNGTIKSIAAAIDGAQHYAHIEYYALVLDAATECVFVAMERAVERGVKVRVLYDHLGSLSYKPYKAMQARLAAAGIEAHRMLAVDPIHKEWSRLDLRNHRKIVIVDGQVGFTGSQNLVLNTYHGRGDLVYEELVARVCGPVVAQLEAVFTIDWFCETSVVLDGADFPEIATEMVPAGEMLAQVLPSGSAYESENNLRLFIALLHAAQYKAVITTPYFVPDDGLLSAITIAAERGVDVTLIVSGVYDQFVVSQAQQSYYEELLEVGVKIRLFKPPVMLHAKNMSIDDDIAAIGSSNMDMRSFQLNLEITLVLYDREAVARLRAIEATYIARSTPVLLDEWRKQSFGEKFVQNSARLVSALL
jgi:cardiolipin synthase A/B